MRGAAIGVAVSLTLVLSACSSVRPPEPSETLATSIPQPIQSEPPAGVAATLSIAGLDLDGKSASAAGFVSGIVESGGSCDYRFANADSARTVSAAGTASAATTACGLASVPLAELESGTWSVTLSYRALDGAVIESAPLEFEVP